MPVAFDVTDELNEECGVFGIIGRKSDDNTGLEAARLTFYGLWALQHRGQESSGIVSSDGHELYRHAAQGLVATVYREEDLEQLPGHLAIGHNRYSTSGGIDDCYNQPFLERKNGIALAHNGTLPDTTKLETFLKSRGVSLKMKSDSGMMSAAISCFMDDGLDMVDAIKQAWPLFTGAFSIVAMDATRLVAFRDECGIRPLSIGTLDDGYVVASETCAFDTVGAKFLRDVKPGELVVINDKGLTVEQIVKSRPKLDIFEMIYFSRPDSQLLGQRIDIVRQNFGRQMAKEFPIEADVIVPVPDSAIPAALGYSQASGIPFEMALIKNRYIHRTFIRPTAQLRERDLKMKLNPVVELLKDKRVVLVDDSIVRGTTMRHLVSMVFEAGAREVHLIITCPPMRHPDFYGINTPHQTELMAAYMTVPEMRDHVGATSLHFLSFDGMIKATGHPASRFNTSCFDGQYPISIGKHAKEVTTLKPGEKLPMAGRITVELANTRTSMRSRIAILASGGGTTAEAFIRAGQRGETAVDVGLVICSRRDAGIFERITNLNKEFGLHIECILINHQTHLAAYGEHVGRGDQTVGEETAILAAILGGNYDLVALMGYMKRVGANLIEAFGWQPTYSSLFQARMVNTHPGLLPDTKGFYGQSIQQYVLDHHLPYGGQTLHVVSGEYDEGPIIAEHHVPVEPGDTAETLFARVQAAEKKFLPGDIEDFIKARQAYLAS